MIEKQTKGRFSVLERAKVSQKMADFITKESLKAGCSRSQVVRDALEQYMTYEESRVLTEVKVLHQVINEMSLRIEVMGQYEQGRFDQLLKAVKAYRKA
ncbi:MAG: hypothetical protein OEY29_05935 [Gammaproteobacteria bacterium]|nr:hypothetical protein [Gammaproteobacteria bacterium]